MKAGIDFVKSGKIGKLKVARGLCYKPRGSIGARGEYAPPKSVNYNLWLGPAPESPVTRPQFHYDWHWQWAYGNGDLGNQGIHQMDIARWGLGSNQLCRRVISYGGRFGYEDAGETANTQVVVHDYDDQSLVFEVRGLSTKDLHGAKVGVIFECADGYVVMNSYDSGVAFDLNGNMIEKFSGGADHFDNFLTAVRSRNHQDLTADIEEGHLSSALCHLGNISYVLGETMPTADVARFLDDVRSHDDVKATFERTLEHLKDNGLKPGDLQVGMGAMLEFDPETEQFVGHEKANSLLTREYRAPFVVPARDAV
jgi:predicted dehydrogenase